MNLELNGDDMKISRVVTLVIMIGAMLLLGGCSLSSTPFQLLQAPIQSQQQSNIRQEVLQHLPPHSKLVIPDNGPYGATAIFIKDMMGNGQRLVIAFYANEADEFEYGYIVLGENNGEWERLDQVNVPSRGVDFFQLADLNGDGRNEIITGWKGGIRGRNELQIHSLNEQKKLELAGDMLYTQMLVTDLDGSNRPELFNLSWDSEKMVAEAALYEYHDRQLSKQTALDLDGAINGYAQVVTGRVSEQRQGIVIVADIGAHSSYTSMLIKEQGQLKDVLNPDPLNPEFYNAQTTLSEDVNGDGILEIDRMKEPPGTEDLPYAEMPFIHEWLQWGEGGKLQPVMNSFYNFESSYRFDLPERWTSQVTLRYSGDNDESITFKPLQSHEVTLLEIKVVSMADKTREMEKWKQDGLQFVSLREGKDKWIVGIFPVSLEQYAAAVKSLAISEKELARGFKDMKF